MTPEDFGVCMPHQLADPRENLLKYVRLVDRRTHNRKHTSDKNKEMTHKNMRLGSI